MVVTIKNVAELAKVSKSTVSNVLTGKRYVSPEITERVQKACKQLNYYPSFVAASLATKKTGIIGLFLGTEEGIYHDFYSALIKGIATSAAKVDMKVLLYLYVTQEEMEQHLTAGKGPIDGAILLTPIIDDYRIKALSQEKINIVTIGNPNFEMEQLNSVDVDNISIAYEITKRLIQSDHENILFINSVQKYTISQDRAIGFYKALNECGESSRKSYMINSDSTKKSGYEITKQTLEAGFKVNAIIVACSELAKGAYQFLEETNQLNKDIVTVVLGGETDVLESFNPPVSYVLLDYEEMGKKSFDVLYNEINRRRMKRETKVAHKIHYIDGLSY